MTNEERKVMEQALEALEKLFGIPDQWTGEGGGDVAVWRLGGSMRSKEAITALRHALEQPRLNCAHCEPVPATVCKRCLCIVPTLEQQPADEPVAFPKGRDLFLRDDMGQGQLRVMFDGDNDVIVAIWPYNQPSASVEFCNGFNGGGKSLETRKALIALMCAMERDGAQTRPHDNEARPQPAAPEQQINALKNEAWNSGVCPVCNSKDESKPTTWVGLTEDEIHAIYDRIARQEPYGMAVTRRSIGRAIEQALKEKNT